MRISLLIMLVLTCVISKGQTYSKYITIDQFGYRPAAQKVAIIRNPQVGFDASESFTPGTEYAVINTLTGDEVFTGAPVAWNSGATDDASGDQVWRFDFSSVTEVGEYYVLDVDQNLKSFDFQINANVYRDVLKHAVRSYYYQRAGVEKLVEHAGAGWADGASHIGPGQDTEARLYSDPDNASTEKDVSGMWYDAGDYNKYTPWTCNVVTTLLHAYDENPHAFADDYGIPESGNGIPDLMDELKFGLEGLLRLQHEDGSMIAIVDLDHATPPSSASGVSLYGAVNTYSAWNGAAVFAYAATLFSTFDGMDSFVSELESAAIAAYEWGVANPNVEWNNNDAAYGSEGIGSGRQETDDYGRAHARLRAAMFLFELTGEASYKSYFDSNYSSIHLMEWWWAYPYEEEQQQTLLYYTTISGASTSVVDNILNVYKESMEKSINFENYDSDADAYQSYIDSYTWGSNRTKSAQGNMFYAVNQYDVNASRADDAETAAENYLHNLHGANPLSIVYLSNMYDAGGDNCVNEFYHTWFHDGSEKWDRVGESTYGPPPGYLVGGPNSSYNYDGCCPDNCGGSFNNAKCTSVDISNAVGQPAAKSYIDINDTWPINSWEITENSTGYQAQYVRLLSKYVDTRWDCDGVVDGNGCDNLATGEGHMPLAHVSVLQSTDQLQFDFTHAGAFEIAIHDLLGRQVVFTKGQGKSFKISTENWVEGVYVVAIMGDSGVSSQKIAVAH